ncbi:MAG: aldehyde dehydrogenase family protein, partial [Firmicutes bacterium]|nr:aldehyde dehydrogenase family protein [Bacillota bacterium]
MENEAILAARAEVAELVEKARAAQREFESFSQEKTDEIVRAIGKLVYDNAEPLAQKAVEESRMGVYADKVAKCHGKAKIIWNSLKGKKSIGIIGEDPETGIIRVAKPKGVVCAVTPVTNPVVTPMCNAMFALKGHNAIIVAPHPTVKNLNNELIEMFRAELEKLGAPVDLIQTVAEPTLEKSGEIMRQCDVVVATGGAGMVKAAYSSGKPALGVGAGNTPAIIDDSADVTLAVNSII